MAVNNANAQVNVQGAHNAQGNAQGAQNAQDQNTAQVIKLTNKDFCDFVPPLEEVEAYAEHIGIDTEYDRDLFWIAEAGLVAPVQEPWVACQSTGDEDVFFWNSQTGESVWDHPMDDHHRELVKTTMAERVLVPLTLAAAPGEACTYEVTATNLAGCCLATLTMRGNDRFSDLRQRLSEQLDLPKGTSERLVVNSAMLGHSWGSKSVAEVFDAPPTLAGAVTPEEQAAVQG